MTAQPKPFDVALSLASHARTMGYRRIAILQSKQSDSCYVYFDMGLDTWRLRVSDHKITYGNYDYDLADLTDIAPALEWMRKPRRRPAVMK